MEDIIPKDYPDFFKEGDPPCASTDPEAFFPQDREGGRIASYYNESGAKAVCKTCPYMIECLTYAVKNSEIGIWGGTTEGERKEIRRSLRSGKSITEITVRING
jgi:WhiB family redox-sensing transcriptional regulator